MEKILKPMLNQKIDKLVDHPTRGPTFFNIANLLTIIRIFISPIFLLLYIEYEFIGLSRVALPYFLLGLLLISELSDALDGYLARRYNQVTDLGKILDPMADSISRISIFLTFTQPPVNVPILCIFIFLYRDSVVSTLRTICALRGVALAARPSGKIKAVIQSICSFFITGLLIPHSIGALPDRSLFLMSTMSVLIACIYSLYSAFDYLQANWKYIMRVLTRKPKHFKSD